MRVAHFGTVSTRAHRHRDLLQPRPRALHKSSRRFRSPSRLRHRPAPAERLLRRCCKKRCSSIRPSRSRTARAWRFTNARPAAVSTIPAAENGRGLTVRISTGLCNAGNRLNSARNSSSVSTGQSAATSVPSIPCVFCVPLIPLACSLHSPSSRMPDAPSPGREHSSDSGT